jgi:AcrR family transcriptional regulator
MAVQESANRRRNPRGHGDRLREDIIDAASQLLSDPAAPPLTLRGVARAAGIAATSVYLHFADTDALLIAVADRHFGELAAAQQAARDAAAGPRDAVLAMALAYCDFGLANPGLYQVMFGNPLPAVDDPAQIPGRAAFEQRTEAIAAALRAAGDSGGTDASGPATGGTAFGASLLIWQLLHGTVGLRISRALFPWPPVTETVTAAVGLVLDGASASQHQE